MSRARHVAGFLRPVKHGISLINDWLRRRGHGRAEMSAGGCSMVDMTTVLPFTEADIKDAAGPRSFERGLEYLGQVADLEINDSEITATVYGSRRYRVSLAFGDDGLSADCTCPYGRDGAFCKHCVAVAMSVLNLGQDLPRLVETAKAERAGLDAWLRSLSKQELLATLLGLLGEDPDLRRRFELRAASVNADAVKVRRAVRELIALPRPGYVGYDQVYDYASGVSEAARAIDDLIEAGDPADAIGIAREAFDLLNDAFEYVDDSSGVIGQAGCELLAVHLRACRAARPDPISLAEYLSGLLLHNEYGLAPDLGDYAGLLGEKGIAAVRERVAAAYAQNPKDWQARTLMESIAKAEGDIDTVVAVYAADLDDRGWSHLRIAEELDEAGRGDEALGWAERGLREAARPDQRLVDYLAGRYAAAGRDEDVLGLRRDRFEAERTLGNYQALRHAAAVCGVWPQQRDRALALLRKDARLSRGTRRAWAWIGPVLIDALLDDGDLDAAWDAAPDTASDVQWLRLADASAVTRPADALPVYLRAIDAMKSMTGDPVYHKMAGLLLSARACHQALGTTDKFRGYLAALRTDQKRKRNLMKILDANNL
jgi:tetratricopeptide (TPR) repeat protein